MKNNLNAIKNIGLTIYPKSDIIVFLVAFINFIGYYVFILLIVFLDIGLGTTAFTGILRVSVVGMIFLFFLNYRIHLYREGLLVHILMLVFLGVYVFQSVNAYYTGVESLGTRAPIFHIIMALIYLYMPFVFFATIKSNKHFDVILRALLYSAFIFSLFVLILYWELLVSGISRITFAIYTGIEIGTVNALILAYMSSIGIGVFFAHKLYSVKESWSLFSLIYVGVLLVPFLLGSSRGALFALLVPFFMIIVLSGNFKSRVYLLSGFFFGVMSLYFIATHFEFGVFRRTLRIITDLEAVRSTQRVPLWGHAISQFLESPIYGDMIYFTGAGGRYPHNIILEVFMTTGLIGGLSYITILLITVYYSFYIVKNNQKLNWVVVLYWQSFIAASLSFELIVQVIHFSSIGLLVSAGCLSKKRFKR